MKLHLHIGTEKTGTTSFQRWLLKNRAQLAKNGVIYPDLPRLFPAETSQRLLSIYAEGALSRQDADIRHLIRNNAAYTRICSDFAKSFAAEVATHGDGGQWVISGEHLQSRLVTPGQVERLHRFLTPFFNEIIVYIHLRPQVDLARSAASTLARAGGRISAKRFQAIDEHSAYHNYAALVQRWEAVFGPENLRLVPYKRHPSFQHYFLHELGLQEDQFAPVARLNEQLDWRVMAMANAIQPHRSNTGARGLPPLLEQLPFEQPLHIGMKLALGIFERLRPGNEALVKAHPELTMDDLTPDWASYEHPENLSQLEAECAFGAPLAAWMALMRTNLRLEKCRTRLAEAERARLSNATRKARAYLLEALELINGLEAENPDQLVPKGMKNRAEVLAKHLLPALSAP